MKKSAASHARGKFATVAGVLTVLAIAGCGGDREQGAMTADLERDLELAIAAERPRSAVVSAIEGGPVGAPSGAEQGRRDAVPTPRRTPRPTPQAEVVQETPTLPVLEEAAAPAVAITEQVEPTPTPVPEPAVESPAPGVVVAVEPQGGPSAGSGVDHGAGDHGEGAGRRGGGIGGIIGVIIRGGAAGVDNCEEHDRRAGRRGRGGTVIAGGRGGGVITRGGGWGGAIGGAIGDAVGSPTFPRSPTRYPRY